MKNIEGDHFKDAWRYRYAEPWLIDKLYNNDPTDQIIAALDGEVEADLPDSNLMERIENLLSSKEAFIVTAHAIDCRSFRDIANELGCHHSWCHVLYNKAMLKLREEL
jgi:DNA-directed RNA polymerase specialized sigma24 family protein